MTDLDRASLDRILPETPGSPDWDDVLNRAGARSRARTLPPSRWRVVVIALAIVASVALLATPALGIGDRLLDLIQGAPARPEVQSPVWSPDGRRIAFVSRRDGKALYVMNADGSGLRIVARVERLATPAWSPDGQTIAVAGDRRILLVNADGSGQRNVTREWGLDGFPAWSPDARRIAFFASRRPGINVMNADGSGRRTLTRLRAGRTASLAWSSDGKKLLFLQDNVGCGDFCFHLYVLNADGSGLRDLTRKLAGGDRPGAGPASDPVWSHDGRRIAFVRLNTRLGVYVVNADGSGMRNLTPKPAEAYAAPAWSPNGKKITFASERAGNSEIYLMNADGSGQRSLTRQPGVRRRSCLVARRAEDHLRQ